MNPLLIFKHNNHKELLTNIFSLGTIQLVNYVLPLLTVPYLVRILKPDYFGLIAFSTATISYFIMLTDYGFNLSATRQISIHRNDLKKLNEIFNSTIFIQAGLLLVSFALLCILIFSFDRFTKNWELYMISFGMVIGHFLFPVWLFQGMEKMKYITFINVGTKVFFTISIFILVKEKEDYLMVPFLTSASYIFSGILSLTLASKKFNLKFNFPAHQEVKTQLKEGWYIFKSNLSISLYTTSTTFILGLLTNNTWLGYFAAADKIIHAAKGINGPISQSIYPLISNKIQNNKKAGIEFIKKAGKIISLIMFFTSFLLLILAKPICLVILGAEYHESIILLQLMSFLPFIIALSNLFAVQGLYNFGMADLVSKYLSIIALIHLSLITLLIMMAGVNGAAIGVLITEIMVTVLSIYYFNKEVKNESHRI
jgi:polysaccharide transporter, PST family